MTSCLASSVGCDLKEGTTYSFLFPKHLAQCLHIMSAKYFGEEREKKKERTERRKGERETIIAYVLIWMFQLKGMLDRFGQFNFDLI